MGRLLGLELHNFKSYKDTTVVGFGDSHFTSIVGPNGSGKSNMMDAISFVLGVKSHHLRSSHLRDLIYRGRQDTSADSAYVKATYETNDGATVELLRTISGTGESKYKIDGATVTLSQYSDFLKAENILIRARNFLVFQGDVENIAAQSATELTKLVETISGSIELKKEYDELREEQEAARENTTSILSRKKVLNGEFKQYKVQTEQAREFEEKLQERATLVQQRAVWQLHHVDTKKKALEKRQREELAQQKKLKKQVDTDESLLKQSKSSFAKQELASVKLMRQIAAEKNVLSELARKRVPIEANRDAALKKQATLEKRLANLTKDVAREEDQVKQFEKQHKVVSRALEAHEKEVAPLVLSPENQQLYDSLRDKFLSSGGSSLEEQIALLENDRSELQMELKNLETLRLACETKIQHELASQEARLEEEMSQTSSSLNDTNAKFSMRKQKLKELQAQLDAELQQETALQTKLRDVLVKLDDLSATQRESMREKKLRENVATLKRLFPGVKGLVSDLCQPKQAKFGVAVSTILGRNFDSVVVETTQTAQHCISYLKEQRAGSATFIPLDSIEVSSASVAGLPQGTRMCIDVVDYEPLLEKAIQYVCSNSVVCDTMDLAKYVKWTKNLDVKVVTLEGSLIHRAGLMTGGASKEGSNRWDKNQYQTLMGLRDEYVAQLKNMERLAPSVIRDVETEILTLDNELGSLREVRARLERSLSDVRGETEYQKKLILDYSSKIENLQRSLPDERIGELREQVLQLQNEVYSEFTARAGFTVQEYERQSGDMLRKHAKETQQLNKELMTIDNKLSFERERLESTQSRLNKAQRDLEKLQYALDQFIAQETSLAENVVEQQNLLNELESQASSLGQELSEKMSVSKKYENALLDVTTAYNEFAKTCQLTVEDLDQLAMERDGILKACQMDNVDVNIELPVRLLESSSELIQQEFEDKIAAVTAALESLQPNSKSMDRLIEVENRLKEVDAEYQAARRAENEIVNKFVSVKRKRYELFTTAFNHIAKEINGIYRELTRINPNSQVELAGGSAYLTLEDEDEPYLAGVKYHATPPMKRFKDMEYLSGGEKTIAALALLFAIHSYHPSPFFVLDEVDAALDNANVNRIATYINRHANNEFQFIVISLKNSLFEKSDALVGIYRDQEENSSKTVSLDLRQYSE